MKRAFDIIVSSLLAIPALPVVGILAIAVRTTIGSPVLLRQERLGKDGEPFTMYKFRGMTNARNSEGNLLPAKDRLTPIGKFMRDIGVDEVPQLWNVFKGDMSFVGPRPRLYNDGDESQQIPDKYKEILSVRPGITGTMQVARMYERRELPLERTLQLDWEYAVQKPGLLTDLTLMVKTVPVFVIGNAAGTPVNTKLSGMPTQPR